MTTLTRLARRALVPVVAAALVATLPLPAVSAAPRAGGSFSTSFEDGDPAVPVSTSEVRDGRPVLSNVTARKPSYAGSVMDGVTTVTGDATSSTDESPQNLTDGDPTTKWLTRATTGFVAYELAEPVTVTRYRISSANDAAGRDPVDWTMEASTDGTSWTALDTRTDQDLGARLTATDLTIDNATAYRFYRLRVTRNAGEPLTQLGDWLLSTGKPDPEPTGPMTTEVGAGPASGPNVKARTGYEGLHALRYSASHTKAGRGYATNVVADVDVRVDRRTRLTYRVFPELTGNDLTYPATDVAIDLRFTDGSYLSDLQAVDQHDGPLTAQGQGRSKILYANQWNHVQSDIGDVAAGRTIDRVLLAYDNPSATRDTELQGWVDTIDVGRAPAAADTSDRAGLVDTRRGTNSSGSFSRGNNLPISAVPNGFNFLTPVTNATSQSWEYDWQRGNDEQNLPTLQGLAFSHEPSPWMGDRNQLSFMPQVTTEPTGDVEERALQFSHDDETARPDYYGVRFTNGVRAEMTPTSHAAVLRFTFPRGADARRLVVDTVDDGGSFTVEGRTLTGWVDNGSGLSAGRSRMFVHGVLDSAATASGTAPGGREGTTYADLGGRTVTLRVATSFISLDQARRNLALEVGDRSFAQVRKAAQGAWAKRLAVIDVKGASDTQARTLYGNLYRLNLYPNAQHENVGSARRPDWRYASPVSEADGEPTATRTGAKVVKGEIYVNNGFWDTYRTVWPAYSLLYPDVAAKLADGFVQHYRDGGWVSRWSSPGYADLMTGTSSDVSFADAYLRGVKLPDPLGTYDAAVKNATTVSPDSAVGRKGLETSQHLGYTSTDTDESVSWALEGFINDYGISNMAAKLAKDPATPRARRAGLREDAAYFGERTQNYVNMFDPATEFFQGREADGTFAETPAEFDPESWGGVFTETNGWNFAFHAPQDGRGLANLYGSRKALEDKLDTFFATPEKADKPGGYGGVIHEMLEARDVRMGQLGMSNQPSHHIPYMYDYVGAPQKTQAKVREIMRRLYTGGEIGQGYPGDEDNGEMSAWYLLSSLGIYPLQVGSDRWAIGSPLFEKATVHPIGGRTFSVRANGNSTRNVYVQSLRVDGKKWSSTSLPHDVLRKGGTLDFQMGARPSDWGTGAKAAPPSITQGTEVPRPLADVLRDGTTTPAAPALTDDDAGTVATLGTDGTVTWKATDDAVRPRFYTLTSGTAVGADPRSWVLEGSRDGRRWTTLDERSGETFRWRQQTRSFEVDDAGSYAHLRLRVTSTSDGTPARLGEMEVLARPAR
ncbi:GH92 family glycosyl hydrolase [Solicola sp. PLA-1-18]|uniref:GH92 family glycosyl hydrolase n=1 Tax=Solicola sp. PLA-1-18 TaxID=3380532 RepID=UPI003B827B82